MSDALIKTRFFCPICHGSNLISDAPCKWDFDKQEWVRTGEVYEDTYCEDCETEIKVQSVEVMV